MASALVAADAAAAAAVPRCMTRTTATSCNSSSVSSVSCSSLFGGREDGRSAPHASSAVASGSSSGGNSGNRSSSSSRSRLNAEWLSSSAPHHSGTRSVGSHSPTPLAAASARKSSFSGTQLCSPATWWRPQVSASPSLASRLRRPGRQGTGLHQAAAVAPAAASAIPPLIRRASQLHRLPSCRSSRLLTAAAAAAAAAGAAGQPRGPPRPAASTDARAHTASGSGSESSRSSSSGDRVQSAPGSLPFLGSLTPYRVATLVAGAAVGILVLRLIVELLVEAALGVAPPLLTYGGTLLVFWPWLAAVALGAATLAFAVPPKAEAGRQKKEQQQGSSVAVEGSEAAAAEGRAAVRPLWQQVVVLVGALTWLILVPCAHFQGFLGAWPWALFVVYCFFFSVSAIVRSLLYGNLAPRSEDRQWASPTSRFAQVAFVIALVGSHWRAAWEAPRALLPVVAAAATADPTAVGAAAAGSQGGWSAGLLLLAAVWLHWDATMTLGKNFDRLVVPQAVVTTGPYRAVRHPIYTSYMLLFAGFCAALKSYTSMAIVLVACLLYYTLRTALEEEQLEERFGDVYRGYKARVTTKFLPYLL